MKRLILSTVTLFLLLAPASAIGASAGSNAGSSAGPLETLGLAELAAVTAGICTTCPPKDEPPPLEPPPYVVSLDWDIVSRKDTEHTQVSYGLEETYVNGSSQPYSVSRAYQTNCRRILVSGGFGISQGLSLQVGTVYNCSASTTLNFQVPAYRRVKLYRADMRYYIDYVAKEYMLWSDGYREATGHVDRGKERRTYTKFNPVVAYL